MDPLTHSLVGANLASTPFASRTRFAVGACLVGANLPDVDAITYFMDPDISIGFRRGWTHGALALLILPVLLWLCLHAWSRIFESRQQRDSPDSKRLLLICYLAVLTHPFLDWLNSYGMRWLMPFDGRWFYGDAVFIMDPWLWLILAGAWLIPRSPGRKLTMTWAVFSALLGFAVAVRVPRFLPLIAFVSVVLFIALRWKSGDVSRKRRFAVGGLLAASIYVLTLIGLRAVTEHRVLDRLSSVALEPTGDLFVGPLPIDPLSWDVLVDRGDHYRYGRWSWWDRSLSMSERKLETGIGSTILETTMSDSSISGFVTWVRYPWISSKREGDETRVHLLDARYSRSVERGFGGVSVLVGTDPAGVPANEAGTSGTD